MIYKITLLFGNGFEAIYPSVDVYIETKRSTEKFCHDALGEGGVWIYDIATETSQITHNRNILRAQVEKVDPADVVQTPYVVKSVK